QSLGQDGFGLGVYAKRYSAGGGPQGAEFLANTFTTGDQLSPAVAVGAAGDFVIPWASYRQGRDPTHQSQVYPRRHSPPRSPAWAEIRVNTFTSGDHRRPAVAASPAGDFVVAWHSYGQDNFGGVYAQRYARTAAVEAVRSAGSAVAITPGAVVAPVVSQLVVTF